ncbi:MAG: AAA family ATPase, partial [Bacillota bacterium]|nr:AAA family ATPase [Bacillota bacterium]
MKPLRLVLSGLNSFKEEQTIDFTYLCDGNVFGIFGPTGSGKSTLIDAITLALYGRVERAPGKVQGIVNKGT